MPKPRMTLQTQIVLRQALLEPTREWYGLEMVNATGLPTGTVYPIVARLERIGWFERRQESLAEQTPERFGRPLRLYYKLTDDGTQAARLALAEAHQHRGTDPIPWGLLPRPSGAT